MRRILIFGGTGFIGTQLIKELKQSDNYIILATHSKITESSELYGIDEIVEYKVDDYTYLQSIEAIDVIINLAGENIIGLRWTGGKKRRILESRLKVISVIEAYVKDRANKIPLLVQASATGFYGYSEDITVNEASPAGDGFLADTCKTLEEQALSLDSYFNRIAVVRFGIVLGDGGFIKQMLKGFKFGVGFSFGNGRNWFSWIHLQDVVKGISFIIATEDLTGVINFVTKESIRFSEFVKILARLRNNSFVINIPSGVCKLALGEMADMLMKGISIEPKKLIDSGYEFSFVSVDEALRDIIQK